MERSQYFERHLRGRINRILSDCGKLGKKRVVKYEGQISGLECRVNGSIVH